MNTVSITDQEYKVFTELIFDEIGITLNEHKKSLMESRFYKRIMHYKLTSFYDYYKICKEDILEKTEMLNLITTNETYFFRENDHFEFLKDYLINYTDVTKLRIWSAASSVGAEAYSIAMICDSLLASKKWEVLGSDINKHVIKKARMGLFPISWSEKISPELRHKYCLKGKGKYEGQFLIDRQLAKNVRFVNGNLLELNNDFGKFDIVFLRNVLIYFSDDVRKKVLHNIMTHMQSGSLLIISQTENLNTLNINELEQVHPSIFKVK